MKFFLTMLCILATLGLSHAQTTISGTITDNENQPLPGTNIIEKGTTNGTISDFDGKYTLNVPSNATLTISFVGYETSEVNVSGRTVIDVSLKSKELEEIIVVGSRTAPRSSTDTPLPVDVLSSKELASTGQNSFDKALQYKIPSFNTVQTPVNDATSLLDPYEIRNLGPSRTLILINGKRKNMSSLLYVQTSPGRGETGADISAIPTDAIKRVEVLRDGASAQYGSDAIAGVMNIILKNDTQGGSATLRSGITGKGDGFMMGLSANGGMPIGKGKGFINYTVDFSKIEMANRPGKVSAEGEAADFTYKSPTKPSNYFNDKEKDSKGFTIVKLGNTVITQEMQDEKDQVQVKQIFEQYKENETTAYEAELKAINNGNTDGRKHIDEFLARYPDARNINASPATTAAKFLINGEVDLSDHAQIYFNAAYVYKKVNSFANYRTPYWRTIGDFPYLSKFFPDPNGRGGYDGYVPTFDGELSDYNGTVGIMASRNGWNYDVSMTVGGNKQTYRVRNSHNRSKVLSPAKWIDANKDSIVDAGEFIPSDTLYQQNSPTSFNPGGTEFSHLVGNVDINKTVLDNLGIGFGAEFRSEFFTVIPGELASYDDIGADSFAGNRPENSGTFNRYNLGGYLDISWDIIDDVLLNGTVRMENYSDFGNAFVWKLTSRYKFLNDKMTLRASVSTGFRAPTLHQIYTQKAQYSFVPGQGIQIGGIVSNVSPQARLLEVPNLKAERSTNITVGIGGRFFKNLSFTVDYYNIAMKDRILLSSEISKTEDGNSELDRVLKDNNLKELSFFINGIDTRTSGLDVVVSYHNLRIGQKGFLNFNLSGNYTLQNEREGAVKNPDIIQTSGNTVADATQEALFFTSRPKTKWIFGINYEIGKFDISLNNTFFGKTSFVQSGLHDESNNGRDKRYETASFRTEFTPKVVTDIGVSIAATEKLTIALNVNNVLNVLPAWKIVAKNADAQSIMNDNTITGTGLTESQNQSNRITFNQRYSQMTYDGYHFSQLGLLVNLAVNYRF